MTTIATDGRSMAGDGMMHCQGTRLSMTEKKVRRLPDGRIFGACGTGHDGHNVAAWLADQNLPKPEVEDDFGAMVLGCDGQLLWYSNRLVPEKVTPPLAMGSGMDFAIGAMAHGATPSEAVAISSRYNPHTGGTIHCEYLEASDGNAA